MTSTTKSMMSTGELTDRQRVTTAEARPGIALAVLSNAGFVLRQLAGCLAIIVLVWAAVMLFRHVQTVALVLAGVVLGVGCVALFVRNQSLSRGV